MLIIARRRGSGSASRQQFGEAPPLALLGAHVKLLALIDIEEEGRRLGLIELLAAALGGVDQVGQASPCPAKARSSHAAASTRSGSVALELPGVEETIDQRLDRLGAGLQREKAPSPAVLKRPPARRWTRAHRSGQA